MPTTPRSSRSSPRTTPSATTRCDPRVASSRSEEHTSELQSRSDLVCRLLLEKKKINKIIPTTPLKHPTHFSPATMPNPPPPPAPATPPAPDHPALTPAPYTAARRPPHILHVD